MLGDINKRLIYDSPCSFREWTHFSSRDDEKFSPEESSSSRAHWQFNSPDEYFLPTEHHHCPRASSSCAMAKIKVHELCTKTKNELLNQVLLLIPQRIMLGVHTIHLLSTLQWRRIRLPSWVRKQPM